MSGRPWTTKEVAKLRELASQYPDRVLAQAFNRPISGIRAGRRRYCAALKMGHTRMTDRMRDKLRKLHTEGQNDREIAKALGVHFATVWKHRKLMGLPHNGYSARQLSRTKWRHHQWLASQGVGSLAEIQQLNQSLAAARAGWPADCAGLAHRILDVLDRGPATLKEITRGAGQLVRHSPQFHDGGNARLWLMERGYIKRLDRVPNADGTRMVWRYALAIQRAIPGNPFSLERFASSTDEAPSPLMRRPA